MEWGAAPRVTELDESLIRLLGCEDEEDLWIQEIKANFLQAIPARYHGESMERLKTVLREQQPLEFEHELIRQDGSLIRALGLLLPLEGEKERCRFFFRDRSAAFAQWMDFHRRQYLELLSRDHEAVLALDLLSETLRIIYAPPQNPYLNFDMTLDSALEQLGSQVVEPEDYATMRALVHDLRSGVVSTESEPRPTYRLKIRASTGESTPYQVEFFFLSPTYVLIACGSLRRQGEAPAPGANPERVYLRTFGPFDVFVDGRPLLFRNRKAKELLALLVDRRGGFLRAREAASYLWEEEAYTPKIQSRYRKVAMLLKESLQEYGVEYILRNERGARCLRTDKVDCDLYHFLEGSDAPRNRFNGSYMTDYSWAEGTLGELLRLREERTE